VTTLTYVNVYIIVVSRKQRDVGGESRRDIANRASSFFEVRAWSFRCWCPSCYIQGADALATALFGQHEQRRLAVRGELAREVGPLGALDS
jgi:hypothetical protein